MVENTLDDNSTFWSPYYTVVENALAGFGTVSGCAISKGTGDWDIDVTSGTVFISGTGEVSVSSGTQTISDSSGLSSGQSRIDLITAQSGGSLNTVAGTGATNPDAPDIPSDEVVLGFVVVADTDSTAADSDIIDVPALLATSKHAPFVFDFDNPATGSNEGTTWSTKGVELFDYDFTLIGGGRFRVELKTSGGNAAEGRVRDTTNSNTVAGPVSTTSATFVELTDSDLSIPSGTADLEFQIREATSQTSSTESCQKPQLRLEA